MFIYWYYCVLRVWQFVGFLRFTRVVCLVFKFVSNDFLIDTDLAPIKRVQLHVPPRACIKWITVDTKSILHASLIPTWQRICFIHCLCSYVSDAIPICSVRKIIVSIRINIVRVQAALFASNIFIQIGQWKLIGWSYSIWCLWRRLVAVSHPCICETCHRVMVWLSWWKIVHRCYVVIDGRGGLVFLKDVHNLLLLFHRNLYLTLIIKEFKSRPVALLDTQIQKCELFGWVNLFLVRAWSVENSLIENILRGLAFLFQVL